MTNIWGTYVAPICQFWSSNRQISSLARLLSLVLLRSSVSLSSSLSHSLSLLLHLSPSQSRCLCASQYLGLCLSLSLSIIFCSTITLSLSYRAPTNIDGCRSAHHVYSHVHCSCFALDESTCSWGQSCGPSEIAYFSSLQRERTIKA